MMHCIYQIDDNATEKIIKVLKNENEFLESVKSVIPTNLKIISLECLTENDIHMNNCFKEGHYLLITNKLIKLVHKFTTINKGHVYNTSSIELTILFVWKLLPFEPNQNTNASHFFTQSKEIEYYQKPTYSNIQDCISLYSPEWDSEHAKHNDITSEENDNDMNCFTEKKYDDSDSDFCFDTDSDVKTERNPLYYNNTMSETTDAVDIFHKSIPEIRELDINGASHTLPISTLDLDNLCDNPSICIIAKRGAGKSWIIRELIDKLNSKSKEVTDDFIKNTLIVSPTEKMTKFYTEVFPQAKITFEYNKNDLRDYMNKINDMHPEDLRNFSGCVILDDCLASKGKWMNDPEISELFYNSRHYNTTFIMAMQFPMGLKPEFRCNFDYVFLPAEDFHTNQKRLYDHYAGMFPTFDLFRQVFLQLTENYGCMVINNRGKPQITDKIFYFKAKNIKNKSINFKYA